MGRGQTVAQFYLGGKILEKICHTSVANVSFDEIL